MIDPHAIEIPLLDEGATPVDMEGAGPKQRADRKRELFEKEKAKLQTIVDGRRVREANDKQVLARVRNFLGENNAMSADLDQRPEIGKWTIDSVREKISELRREAKAIYKRRPSASDVKEAVRERFASLGDPKIGADGWPEFGQLRGGKPGAINVWHGPTTKSLVMAYFFSPETVLARFDQIIDNQYEADAPDREERETRIAEIEGEALQLERIEEELLRKARDEGRDIPRRITASPLALLGIVLSRRAATREEYENYTAAAA